MTIYRQNNTANFTVYSNNLVNSQLPSDAKNVLFHLLSKPKNWKLIKTSIAKALGLSKYAVQQAVIKLRKLGYLVFTRFSTGHGRWDVYETPPSQNQPQTRVVTPSFDIPTKGFPSDLQNNQNELKKEKKTTTEPEPTAEQNPPKSASVVVSFEEIEQTPTIPNSTLTEPTLNPEDIQPNEPSHKNNAELIELVSVVKVTESIKPALVKTLAEISLIEAKTILYVLSHALTTGNVKNPVGYTVQLVKASKNGTLTPVKANYYPTLEERIAKEAKERQEASERGKMDNKQWAAWFFRTHGKKPDMSAQRPNFKT